MNKTILLLLLSSSAFAVGPRGSVYLQCKPKNPCQYASGGTQNCVSKIEISGTAGGSGTETIHYRSADVTREILLVPQQVSVQIRSDGTRLSFYDQTGDQFGSLNLTQGASYQGAITVDQDFEFQVSCQNKAFGYEHSF